MLKPPDPISTCVYLLGKQLSLHLYASIVSNQGRHQIIHHIDLHKHSKFNVQTYAKDTQIIRYGDSSEDPFKDSVWAQRLSIQFRCGGFYALAITLAEHITCCGSVLFERQNV